MCSFFFNTYRGWPALVVRGMSDFILSKEGVTRGNPLSMYLYVASILPLIRSLQFCTQMLYADYASASGLLTDLHKWFLVVMFAWAKLWLLSGAF